MSNNDPPPNESSSSIPLPSTGGPNSSQSNKKKSSAPRRKKGFARRHPFIFYSGALLVVLGIAAAITGVILLAPFHHKASKYNLDTVNALEVGALVLDRNGREVGRISMQDRRLVRLNQLPQHLIDALIATEDTRFFSHHGFDVRGMARAALRNFKTGDVRQGASTITQQLARNAFDLEGKTFDRKFTEIFLANRIEQAYTKNEIIESYFNRIYLGSGFWGVGAAARGYFGKNVEELTVSESATLCALIKSPSRFSPFRNPEDSNEARNRTLARMAELGTILQSDFDKLSAEPTAALARDDRHDRPHFLLTEIRKEALKVLGEGNSPDDLIIKTSVDVGVQDRAIEIVDRSLKLIESREGYAHPTPWGKRLGATSDPNPKASPYLQAAVVAIENKSGRIVCAVGGRNFRESQFNRVWQANSQTGSAFLPFLYAAAYESESVSPVTSLLDAPFDNRRIMIGGQNGVLGEWSTESEEDGFEGNISAAYALAKSKNSPAARMALENMTTEKVAAFVRNMGLDGDYADYPSIYLGTTPANLLDVVRAYAAIPNGGIQNIESSHILSIENHAGTKYYEAPRPVRKEVFSQKTAAQLHESLRATFTEGTGKVWRPEAERLPGHVAGKSGTSYKFKDNWFIGYNAEYTWGVWIGFDVAQTIYVDAFGSDTALPIWLELGATLPSESPYVFSGANLKRHPVCLKTGCKAADGCPIVEMPFSAERWETFRKEAPVCTEHSGIEYRLTSKSPDPSVDPDEPLRARVISKPIVPQVRPLEGEDPYEATVPGQIVKIK